VVPERYIRVSKLGEDKVGRQGLRLAGSALRATKEIQMTEIVETWLNLKCVWLGLKSDRRGVTALEYGLIAAVLATVVIVGFSTLGTKMAGQFTNIATKLS